MTYNSAFPDFPVADMPAMPEGFEDVSWHQDSCPSFENKALGLIVFVDYADEEKRDYVGGYRFTVHETEGQCELLGSDDWADVLAFIERRAS